MTPHLAIDFLLGGVVGWLLVVCWRQRVMLHDLRSRLMLTRPMTIAETQQDLNEKLAVFAERVKMNVEQDYSDMGALDEAELARWRQTYAPPPEGGAKP